MAGERHSEKCTKEEIKQFRQKVINFLNAEKLPYKRVIGLRCYLGQVKIFTGDTCSRLRLRQGRKRMASKNSDNSYVGEADGIEILKKSGGDSLWLKTSEPITEKECVSVFRVDNWEREKEYLKEKLKEDK